MKKCMICGTETLDWSQPTCGACGEATWQRFALVKDENGNLVKAQDRLDLVDAMLLDKALEVVPPAPVKRGPGRPRKTQ